MKSLILFTFLFGLVVSTYAAESLGFFHDPNHPGKCAISSELILSPGEHKHPHEPCTRIICSVNGQTVFQTCGVEAPPEGCTFKGYKDMSLNYPDCCEQEIQC